MQKIRNLIFRISVPFGFPSPIKNPVIVYQMGKVASSSVYDGLRKVKDIDAFHAHYLLPDNIARGQEIAKERGWKKRNESKRLYLYSKLFEKPHRTINLVTLVREPIGRNISAYFQNLEITEGSRDAHAVLDTSELIQRFLEHYPHDTPLTWFDREFRAVTGIDVYSYPFAHDTGWLVIDKPPFRVLIMRSDLPDQAKETQVNAFLGTQTFAVRRSNVGQTKAYADAYKHFIASIRVTPEYARRLLNSTYAKHFFGADELESLEARWTRP